MRHLRLAGTAARSSLHTVVVGPRGSPRNSGSIWTMRRSPPQAPAKRKALPHDHTRTGSDGVSQQLVEARYAAAGTRARARTATQAVEMELAAAAMSDEEWVAFTRRARGGR
jgi:hypothetical protein